MTDWFSQIIVTVRLENLLLNPLRMFTIVAIQSWNESLWKSCSQAFPSPVLIACSMQNLRGLLQAINNWSRGSPGNKAITIQHNVDVPVSQPHPKASPRFSFIGLQSYNMRLSA